jgi:hypothetical protein
MTHNNNNNNNNKQQLSIYGNFISFSTRNIAEIFVCPMRKVYHAHQVKSFDTKRHEDV